MFSHALNIFSFFFGYIFLFFISSYVFLSLTVNLDAWIKELSEIYSQWLYVVCFVFVLILGSTLMITFVFMKIIYSYAYNMLKCSIIVIDIYVYYEVLP